MNVVETGTGVSATGIALTNSVAAKDAMGAKSPREATAESHESAVGGVETAAAPLSPFVASPAWLTIGTEEAEIEEAGTGEAETEAVGTGVQAKTSWVWSLRTKEYVVCAKNHVYIYENKTKKWVRFNSYFYLSLQSSVRVLPLLLLLLLNQPWQRRKWKRSQALSLKNTSTSMTWRYKCGIMHTEIWSHLPVPRVPMFFFCFHFGHCRRHCSVWQSLTVPRCSIYLYGTVWSRHLNAAPLLGSTWACYCTNL